MARPLASTIEDVRQLGELAAHTHADQLAFELIAFMQTANASSLLFDETESFQPARSAIRTRLAAVATRAI
jgi:hypothetical protein